MREMLCSNAGDDGYYNGNNFAVILGAVREYVNSCDGFKIAVHTDPVFHLLPTARL